MADTLGSLIDKLLTVDLKMWNNQEILYKIRGMTFDEFSAAYITSIDGPKQLWDIFKKSCDLNVQRAAMVDEIDEYVIKMIDAKLSGEELDAGKYIQRKHKTY